MYSCCCCWVLYCSLRREDSMERNQPLPQLTARLLTELFSSLLCLFSSSSMHLGNAESWRIMEDSETMSTRCGHCKSLQPHWEKAANRLQGKVKVVAVDLDEGIIYQSAHIQSIHFLPVLRGKQTARCSLWYPRLPYHQEYVLYIFKLRLFC